MSMKTWLVNGNDKGSVWVNEQNGSRVRSIPRNELDLERARLIAAAPDLLEACYGAMPALLYAGTLHPGFIDAYEKVLAATTKAGGRS